MVTIAISSRFLSLMYLNFSEKFAICHFLNNNSFENYWWTYNHKHANWKTGLMKYLLSVLPINTGTINTNRKVYWNMYCYKSRISVSGKRVIAFEIDFFITTQRLYQYCPIVKMCINSVPKIYWVWLIWTQYFINPVFKFEWLWLVKIFGPSCI